MSERFPDVDWHCDRCRSHLNEQSGFDDYKYIWRCTECGYKNSISASNIRLFEEYETNKTSQFGKNKAYVVEMRSSLDDSLIEIDEEEYSSYEDAEWACNEAASNFAIGAEELELSGRDFIEPDDIYFTVGERS